MIRLAVDPSAPDPAVLARAAAAILAGGLVAFPTDTLYGLAADPFNAAAVARLFAVKARAADRAIPLIAADAAQIAAQLGELPAAARRLAEWFWPGPLTLLVHACPALPAAITGGTGSVGVRVPAHEVARGLARACARPLTATSANMSGHAASDDPDIVSASFGPEVDLLLDAGRTPGGPPSTIVDVTGREPQLVRAGPVRWEDVQVCLGRG